MSDEEWGSDPKPGYVYTYEAGWVPPEKEKEE